jgi:tricorn protease
VCLEKEALRGGSRPSIGNGAASRPVFSPDGSEIAFTATYDGNADVYVTPANGGTWKIIHSHYIQRKVKQTVY